jgi:hypothetical protein
MFRKLPAYSLRLYVSLPPFRRSVEEPFNRLGDARFSIAIRAVEQQQVAIETNGGNIGTKTSKIIYREAEQSHPPPPESTPLPSRLSIA